MIEVMLIVSFVAYAHSQAKYEKDKVIKERFNQ